MINENDNILFIGLGGAGQRHLRILRKLLPKNKFFALRKKFKTPLLNSNFTINNSQNISNKYQITEFSNEDKLFDLKPKLTVISCPTTFHTKYTEIASDIESNVLVEKPGLTSLEEFEKINRLFFDSKKCYFVSFQRLYNPLFIKLKKHIQNNEFGKLVSGNVKVSSYVPNWHPYEDFNELYACKRELGGGVLLTECHELNMIINIFGNPENIKTTPHYNENFNLNIEDTIFIETTFQKAKINFDISFLRKPSQREISLIFEKAKIFLDLDKNILEIENDEVTNTFHSEFTNEDMFLNQAKDIVNLKNNNKQILNNQRSLSLIVDKLKNKP